jgi:hypothetical protein
MKFTFVQRLFGEFKLRYLPILLTYFCYGASAITSVANLQPQKTVLLTTYRRDGTPVGTPHEYRRSKCDWP